MKAMVIALLLMLSGCGEPKQAPVCKPTGEYGEQEGVQVSFKVAVPVVRTVQRYRCTDGVDRWR